MEIIQLDRDQTGDGMTMKGDRQHKQIITKFLLVWRIAKCIALKLLVISIFVFIYFFSVYFLFYILSYAIYTILNFSYVFISQPI